MIYVYRSRGFTLIELMIVVAIVGVLASIAFPAYTEQIAKGRRTDAKVQLLAAQQWMERFYSENYRYDKNSAGTTLTDAGSPFIVRFPASPAKGDGAEFYDIELVTPLAQDTFTLRATRSSGTSMAADRCGNFTLDSLGRKGIVAGTFDSSKFADAAAAIRYCWG